jgi:hypothetical protein
MKVQVVLSIDVDVQAWRDEYGDQSLTAAEIRDSVKAAVADAARTDGIVVPAGIIREVEQK